MIRTATIATALAIAMIAFALLLWLMVVSGGPRFTFADAVLDYTIASGMVGLALIGPQRKRWDVYERALTAAGEIVTLRVTFEATDEEVATRTIHALTGVIPALYGVLELVPHGAAPQRARTIAEIIELQIGQTNRNFGTIPHMRARSRTAEAIEASPANDDADARAVSIVVDPVLAQLNEALNRGKRVGRA